MKRTALFIQILILIAFASTVFGKAGYYRSPSIHGNTIVFTAEGDLWTVSTMGGTAERLTSHTGYESRAAISPDGSLVAYSAQYEGPTEVYTIPIQGGRPTRRTFEGDAAAIGWTPDGKILFESAHRSTLPNAQLFTCDINTGTIERLPLEQASDGCFDQSGKTLYFTRFAFQGSNTKRYKGGTAQNIWKYTLGDAEAVPLTSDYEGTSKQPMWANGSVFFVSDRDGTMNLWSMDEGGKNLRQITFHKGWDVKGSSLSDSLIVYQLGADLYIYNIAANTDRLLDIQLRSDFDQMRERWVNNPMDYMTDFNISPKGDNVVLTARGEVFVAPAEQGRLAQVTHKSGVRYRDATFMPDGKELLVLSDESGETEFWKLPANGIGNGGAVTNDARIVRSGGLVSPDGKFAVYSDKNSITWLLNIETGKSTKIAAADYGDISDWSWSPDSKWLAFVYPAANSYSQIQLYNIADAKMTPLTDDRVDCSTPTWSPDGKWIYFLSERNFQSLVGSPWGSREPEPYYDKTTKVYAVSLLKDGRSPFLPTNELVAKADEKKDDSEKKDKDEKKSDDKKKESTVSVTIDWDGLQSRVTEIPVSAGRYSGLTMNDKYLFWMETNVSDKGKTNLLSLEIKNKDISTKTVLEDIKSYQLSSDGKKLLVWKGDNLYVFDASGSGPSDLDKSKVDLSNWKFSIDPHEEWRQMFIESWRLERDYFYDTNMHGVDYKGLLNKHLPLVDRVTDRYELSDLISDIVSELSALHTFVGGGDARTGQDQIYYGSLGADIVRDKDKGGDVIAHIYTADPDYPDVLSPLAKPGVNVHEGDVITAVNGVSTLSAPSISELLRNQSGQQTLLTLKSATGGKEYQQIVQPFSQGDERSLRYGQWEYTRRQTVDKESNSQFGYVHLRAMGGGDFSDWEKNFYPVYNRKGLIIDVRHNNGGNIDSWVLEKLMRKAWFFWQGRTGKPFWNMPYAFRGPMVVLCDQRTASDGEAFSEGFKRLGLGKVVGSRTWGGEIWLSFDNILVDKGFATAAETGVFGPEGTWLIEGHGVDPDIVVDNLPHETFEGQDAQLEAAIKYLQDELKAHPLPDIVVPKYPNKSFKY
jgi:tricorn protease